MLRAPGLIWDSIREAVGDWNSSSSGGSGFSTVFSRRIDRRERVTTAVLAMGLLARCNGLQRAPTSWLKMAVLLLPELPVGRAVFEHLLMRAESDCLTLVEHQDLVAI